MPPAAAVIFACRVPLTAGIPALAELCLKTGCLTGDRTGDLLSDLTGDARVSVGSTAGVALYMNAVSINLDI